MISEFDKCELRHSLGVVDDCRLGDIVLRSNLPDPVLLELLQSEPVYMVPTVHCYVCTI